MNQPAKAQEPTMEEILASIRRIIADDDTSKPPPKPAEVPPPPVAVRPEPPPPRPAPAPPPPPKPAPEPAMRQADIDAMLSNLNAAAPPPVEEPSPAAPDILELTESMATQDQEPPNGGFRTIDGQPDVVFDERPFEPAPPRRAPLMMDADALLSASTHSAVDSAFNTLAHTVLVQNARTLEDLVKEMLRPMLKTWLDDNLPGLVERLVRAEIERVSRGRT
jgi:uncharacterized protein